jgi:hypothetical protein
LWAQITETQALIFSVLEHDEDDADDLLAEHACERGLEAYRLAEQLRRTSGLAPAVWMEECKAQDHELAAAAANRTSSAIS